jgi:hypothetical protein
LFNDRDLPPGVATGACRDFAVAVVDEIQTAVECGGKPDRQAFEARLKRLVLHGFSRPRRQSI